MRKINVKKIISEIKNICIKSNTALPSDISKTLEKNYRKEKNILNRKILGQIIENYKIARKEGIPICQDTGIAVVFIEIGQDVCITGGDLYKAINEGIRQGYRRGYLRKSVVSDPLKRKNTNDNTPAVIHTQIISGNKLKITILPKGAGSENMSAIKMFDPSAGEKDIKDFIVSTIKGACANPCPPILVGVGIGGTFDYAALLSKKALLRKIGERNKDKLYSRLEKEVLKEINKLEIGIQGFGGKLTALDVFIEAYPCHIASLPVAVNIQCHVARRKTVIL